MKLLIDINVILDMVLGRKPWSAEAAELLTAVQEGRAEGCVAAHTITTAHYIIAKAQGKQAANRAISDLLRIVEVVPVDQADFHQALVLGLSDFEDAVQAACALKAGADFIVTRDEAGFTDLAIPAQSAGMVVSLLARNE